MEKVGDHIRVANGTCPKGHSLMSLEKKFDGEKAVFVKIKVNGRFSKLYLNPFYNKFQYQSEIPLSEGWVIELFCPTCGASLHIEDMCRICDVHMFAIHLPDGGQVEICPTVGCHNHALKIVDLDEQLARMYIHETKMQW